MAGCENEFRANAAYYTEIIIEGGSHGYFGDYGRQRWDGTPAITREEQLRETGRVMLDFLNDPEKNR